MKNFSLSGKTVLVLFLLYQVLVETRMNNWDSVFLNKLESSSSNVAELDQESSGKSQQEGSWSQWWSYDGISGPDYWNINKHWNLCSSGRKQSPIDIRTELLVFDHLLGPIQFNWISFDQATNIIADLQSVSTAEESQKSLKVQLLNSGRGIEVWLEPTNSPPIETNSEFIVSHGPLSYAYKLFKIELHSAANFASQQISAGAKSAGRHAQQINARDQASQENSDSLLAEEQVPEGLKSGKSSEHLIDGDSFEAELQLHFYNRHLAASSAQASQLALESRPNLFTSICVFVVASKVASKNGTVDNQKRNNQQSAKNNQSSPIDFILDNLNVIPNQGNLIELKLSKGHIESLITDQKHYITYQGSMNRPPCAENVDWILLNKAIKVDELKLGLLFEKLTTNQENIRPVKALYRRLLRTTISKLDFAPASLEESSRSQCGSNKQTNRNCTHFSKHKQTDTGKTGESETKLRQSSCSMKPNYAYQFSYGQQAGKS